MKSEYEIRADAFLKRVGAIIFIKYLDTAPVELWDDGAKHDAYAVIVERHGKHWRYEFHDSTHNTQHNAERARCGQSREYPSAYDVLSCVQTYDVGTIDDFVSEFGYEINQWADVKRIERIYHAVCEEQEKWNEVFGDVADEFREIFQ